MAIPGPSLSPSLMNTQTVSCRRSASWPGVSNLAQYIEYTAVWAAESVVGTGETETTHISSLYTQVAGVKPRFLSAPATSVQSQPATVQRSPAQYKETDTHHNAIVHLTSSVSWVAVNNVARQQQPLWEAYM